MPGRVAAYDEFAIGIEVPIDQGEQGLGKGLEHGVVAALIAQDCGRDWEDHVAGAEAGAAEDLVDHEAMNAAVTVFEGVDEDEAEGGDGGCDDWVDAVSDEALDQVHPALHEGGDVVGFWADVVDLFAETDRGLADEVLDIPPGVGGVSRIHDRVL